MIHLKPQLIVTILVTSTLLQSCTIEKRTLLSGYHIERVSEANNNTIVRTAEEQQNIAFCQPSWAGKSICVMLSRKSIQASAGSWRECAKAFQPGEKHCFQFQYHEAHGFRNHRRKLQRRRHWLNKTEWDSLSKQTWKFFLGKSSEYSRLDGPIRPTNMLDCYWRSFVFNPPKTSNWQDDQFKAPRGHDCCR